MTVPSQSSSELHAFVEFDCGGNSQVVTDFLLVTDSLPSDFPLMTDWTVHSIAATILVTASLIG